MSQPVWIDLASADDVGPPASIAARAQRGTHVVLRFPPTLDPREKLELIARLTASLPEHSVFDSGGNGTSTRVTVMPVVSREKVVGHMAEVHRAIADYRRTCESLVKLYRKGLLPQEWSAVEHGGGLRLLNQGTNQVVEAPLMKWAGQPPQLVQVPFEDWAQPDWVDPYFFAKFVRTSPGHEGVASLIKHDFHDGARILKVIAD
jgi:hypothetical protein